MTENLRRRQLLIGAPAGIAGMSALVGLLGTGTADADSDTDGAGRGSPSGTWLFEIQVSNGQPVEHSMYALTEDGIVVHVSNNGLIGLGTWRRAATGFVIGFREWLTDNDGRVEGSIHVKLDCAVLDGGGVRAKGIAAGFDLDGNKTFEGTSTGTGARYGIEI